MVYHRSTTFAKTDSGKLPHSTSDACTSSFEVLISDRTRALDSSHIWCKKFFISTVGESRHNSYNWTESFECYKDLRRRHGTESSVTANRLPIKQTRGPNVSTPSMTSFRNLAREQHARRLSTILELTPEHIGAWANE